MAKFNLKVFKKGKPIYWVAGAVILFAVFYFFFNRGTGSSGGVQYVQSGPSEALQAAQLEAATQQNIVQAQVNLRAQEIGAELEAAGLMANIQLAGLMSNENIAMAGFANDAALGMASLDVQRQIAALNSMTSLELAQISSDAAITAKEIDTGLLIHQLNVNQQMFETQSQNLLTQSIISQVPSLKKKDRDETLQYLGGTILGSDVNIYNPPGTATVYLN